MDGAFTIADPGTRGLVLALLIIVALIASILGYKLSPFGRRRFWTPRQKALGLLMGHGLKGGEWAQRFYAGKEIDWDGWSGGMFFPEGIAQSVTSMGFVQERHGHQGCFLENCDYMLTGIGAEWVTKTTLTVRDRWTLMMNEHRTDIPQFAD